LKCLSEKRGCSFHKKESKKGEVEELEEEQELKVAVKRARRATVKKEPDASLNAQAGPSHKPVDVRERKYCAHPHFDC
jgi:hypothetical protein